MARILAIGVATLDWIQVVEAYPAADAEVRAVEQTLCRGGNATNTLVVLSQYGHSCSWLGTLADDVFADIIRADLDRYAIDYSHCPQIAGSQSPASHILLSRQAASRNIVHYRSLRELDGGDAAAIDFNHYDWLHVEGRNVGSTRAMLEQARAQAPALEVSLELEKPRDDIEQLFPYVDHLLCGRAYAHSCGHHSPAGFLDAWRAALQRPIDITCAWGEEGAYGMSAAGKLIAAPAVCPARLVDTRGAGDVFNAGYIDARLNGQSFDAALQAAVALAGRKCGQAGLDGLV